MNGAIAQCIDDFSENKTDSSGMAEENMCRSSLPDTRFPSKSTCMLDRTRNIEFMRIDAPHPNSIGELAAKEAEFRRMETDKNQIDAGGRSVSRPSITTSPIGCEIDHTTLDNVHSLFRYQYGVYNSTIMFSSAPLDDLGCSISTLNVYVHEIFSFSPFRSIHVAQGQPGEIVEMKNDTRDAFVFVERSLSVPISSKEEVETGRAGTHARTHTPKCTQHTTLLWERRRKMVFHAEFYRLLFPLAPSLLASPGDGRNIRLANCGGSGWCWRMEWTNDGGEHSTQRWRRIIIMKTLHTEDKYNRTNTKHRHAVARLCDVDAGQRHRVRDFE